tara:strand:- start:1180 stop:2331 length:1152 start_codon:yes stop_codon:yes gene_type:complete
MAVYKIFPEKDATLYTEFPNRNTGRDELLEARTYLASGLGQVSRYVLKFSDSEITNVITNKIGTGKSEWTAYLRNYHAVVTGLNLDQTLEFYPVAGNWGMGTGKFNDAPEVVNGTSWNWLDFSGSTLWPTSGFATYVTASFSGSVTGGGNWYTGSNISSLDPVTQSQVFTYANPKDILVDVKNTVETWYSYSLDNTDGFANQGFLVKNTDSVEFKRTKETTTTFKYFSIDTNTIYPPELEFRWNDYTFDTGSSTNTILPQVESFISLFNNQGTYYSQSVPRLRFAAMPKYPDRVFLTASLYTTNFYLPESHSLYAVKDTETNEFVIDFDSDYTRISADATSSYFDLYMNGLEPERYYTILVKTKIGDVTKVFDENIMFKVVNG